MQDLYHQQLQPHNLDKESVVFQAGTSLLCGQRRSAHAHGGLPVGLQSGAGALLAVLAVM